jgi:hypothetical protein
MMKCRSKTTNVVTSLNEGALFEDLISLGLVPLSDSVSEFDELTWGLFSSRVFCFRLDPSFFSAISSSDEVKEKEYE